MKNWTPGQAAMSNAVTGMASSPRFQSQRDCVTQPRVASNELPWVRSTNALQPQRGCGRINRSRSESPQPLQGCIHRRLFPRVARSSQPWALLRNPFGIQRHALKRGNVPAPQVTFRKRGRSVNLSATRMPQIAPFNAGLARINTDGVKAMPLGRPVKEFVPDLGVSCAS